MSNRGSTSLVAVAVLLLVAIVTAGVFGGLVLTTVDLDRPQRAAFTLSVDAKTQSIRLTHRGGSTIDPATVDLSVTVNGEPIAHQPPVPFFAATGFISGPTGPFNSAYTGEWTAGQSATLRLARTNTRIAPGARVTVRLAIGGDDSPPITVQATAN